MKQAVDHLTSNSLSSDSPSDVPEHTKPHYPTRTRGLSDRQALIAAMIINGVT